eukprot:144942_1
MNTGKINNYKHVFVEVKCSFLSTDDSIRIQLLSEDWESNLNCILSTIQNTFQSLNTMEEFEWLFVSNGIIVHKHDALQFGDILSTQIPSPAVLEIVTLKTLVNCWLQTKSEAPSPRNDNILGLLSPLVSLKHSICSTESPFSFLERRFVDMSVMSMQELQLLEEPNSPEPPDFNLSWDHVVECIKQEMWPKLASVIKALLNRKNEQGNQMIEINDLSDECIDHIVNILKKNKRLPSEECEYLKRLILRATHFDPNESHYNVKEVTELGYYNDGLSQSLLMDIYDVHKIFVFANFHFREYDMREFVSNISNAFGDRFIETCVPFKPRFNLYPNYIIDDDIFRVFDYHFGVSLFVNTLKSNLYIEKNTVFEVQCIVIPQSVSCVYDPHMGPVGRIGAMSKFLINKHIDFHKTRLKSNTMKSAREITKHIELHYNMEDVEAAESSNKLMIIIDRRASQKTKYDSMYIFPYQNNNRFSELESHYFVWMQFKIVRNNNSADLQCKNKVITHFRYGLNGVTRFYPQMLVSVMPRLFQKPYHLSASEYLYKIYDNTFKNGWCVTLDDIIFDKYYKMITTFTHVSVNYNRHLLYDEFNKNKPMLCFMDLLHHEMKSNNHFNTNDIEQIYSFFDEHGYCTDSIIDDIWSNDDDHHHQSNFGQSMISKHKYNQFDIVKTIVFKYNEPSQNEKNKNRVCSRGHVFPVDKCSLIQVVINGLDSLSRSSIHNMNASDLLGAYDHMVSVHDFSMSARKPCDAHIHILNQIGSTYCEEEDCPILQKHITRRRERQMDQNEDHKHGLSEIVHATLNALHCYILHEDNQLSRGNVTAHFTTMNDNDSVQNHAPIKLQLERTVSDSMRTFNFGESVLQWLDHSEHATFDGFRTEMTQNRYSTINAQTFLTYAQECYIKMNHNKHKQYLLEELMALKIYTDTDIFQSLLRKAHWKSSSKQMKKSFYHWALLLYKTALFHSKPIPRAFRSKGPRELYHGLSQVFVLHNARPKYNGPTSTSLQWSVAHSFSKGIGVLWNIAPSYVNNFTFVSGIDVSWISHHTHEEEVLLIDQYLPITSTNNFDTDSKNNVDHLLYTIKSYTKDIVNKNQFYAILGISFSESWIPCIETHDVLYDPTDKDPNVRVLDVLVEDLGFKQLYNKYKLLSLRFESDTVHKMVSYSLFQLNIYNKHEQTADDCHFEDAEYKVEFDDGNGVSCNIFVKNESLFGIDCYFKLQCIMPNVDTARKTYASQVIQAKPIVIQTQDPYPWPGIAVREGYMSKSPKKGNWLNTGLKKRWFRLWSNKTMQYFTHPYASHIKGHVDFSDMKKMEKKGTHSFCIVTDQREWYFLCKSETDRNAWFFIIQNTCTDILTLTFPTQVS